MTPFLPGEVEAKDPDDTAHYYMDWTAKLLNGATVSSSSWIIQSGLTKSNDTTVLAGNYKTRVTLAGGLAGGNYACTNTVVLSDGQTLQRTGVLRVRER